ncbi:MAG: MTH1187 family thiamine-binding protein [Pirellulales bacterium]|nr:MTH1187 family thiamine-binding protein [Pirellulales bacterium]
MVLLDFSIFPLDKGPSLSTYVARSLEIIDSSGLPYQCHSMGTTLEGEFDEVMDVVRQCFNASKADCDRVDCRINIDYRKGRTGRLQSKIDSIEQKLGHSLKR